MLCLCPSQQLSSFTSISRTCKYASHLSVRIDTVTDTELLSFYFQMRDGDVSDHPVSYQEPMCIG